MGILRNLIQLIPSVKTRYKLNQNLALRMSVDKIISNIRADFYKRLDYVPNLESPNTFNEKIQWLKLNVRDDRMVNYADKYLVRKYVEECGLGDYLIKSYGVYDTFEDIDFSILPYKFVMKVNHDSGGVFVIDKKISDLKAVGKKVNKLLGRVYAHGIELGEWHYAFIKPKIIIEDFVSDSNGELLDFKIHCFSGKPKLIHIDFDRDKNHTRVFYDVDWQSLNFTTAKPLATKRINKPDNLDEMLEIASILSKDFAYSRIDLYNVDNKIYFGEITFFHGSGMEKFTPNELDKTVGDLISLNQGEIK